MMKHSKRVLLTVLLLASAALSGMARTGPWYVGVQGGTSLGQGTFRSITEHEILPGLQGGIIGGYRFNRLLSLEAGHGRALFPGRLSGA